MVLSNIYIPLKVSVVCDSVNISGQGSAVNFPVSENRLSSDLGNLFVSGALSDVIVSCNSKEFNCSQVLGVSCHV